MKSFLIKHKRILLDIAVLFGAFVFVFTAFFVFKPLYFKDAAEIGSTDGVIPRIFIFTCLTMVVLTGAFLKIKNKLTIEILLFLIFLLGFLMQLNYMLITPVNYRQHDVFSYNNAGHQGYAFIVFGGNLPSQVDATGHLDYQFYHPPFNAFMQAMCMRFCRPFMELYNAINHSDYYNVNDWNSLYQTVEILSTFYMNIALYFAIKIVYKLKVENKFKVIAALFVALFPALFILAGQENNDPLCIMNCFIVIYFTVCWWEKHSYFNAIMIGIFGGLAMFAKLSGALIVVPAIVAFAFVLIQSIIKKEKFAYILIQGAIIGAIMAPLGLWFHIYAKIRFNQPFGFVFSNLNSNLYVGDYSFYARFLNIFDFADMFSLTWGNTFVNYNLPNFLIKSALFGEYSFLYSDALAIISLVLNYVFVYLSLILIIIYFIYSGKEHLEIKIIGGVLIVSQLLAQLYFNIKMPYGCTMDFRYIVPIILGFMILNALAFDKFNKEKGLIKYYSTAVMIISICLGVSISLFYLTAI